MRPGPASLSKTSVYDTWCRTPGAGHSCVNDAAHSPPSERTALKMFWRDPRLLVVGLLDQKRVIEDIEWATGRPGCRGLLRARQGGPRHDEPDDDRLNESAACLPASAARRLVHPE